MSINKLSANNKLLEINAIRQMALAFQKSRVLLTAYELDLFTALGEKTKSAAEIAKVLKTDLRATERLMNALCSLGFLNKKQGRFSNNVLSCRYLVKGKPDFLTSLMHTVNMWNTWGTLTQAVRKGKSVLEPRVNRKNKSWVQDFIAAMHERASIQAKEVLGLINLKGLKSVLDMGAGSGAFSAAFARINRDTRVTAFDLPNVIPLTKMYIKKEGLGNKIEFVSGDYLADKLPSGFDLVFLSHIIHSNSVTENKRLLGKCAKSLNPSGHLVIQDFIMDEDRTTPAFGCLFALNMLVGTESGDTYTGSEIKAWLKEAGLSGITRKDTSFGANLIIGKK